MARGVVVVFSLTGWQLFSKALNVSAFFQTFSAASGSCHLVVTVPLRRIPTVMQTVVSTSLNEKQ